MSRVRQDSPTRPSRRAAAGCSCPKCGSAVSADAERCPACGFTGADSMEMFPGPPPPLLPILDAAELWKPAEVRTIEIAREKLRRRFPQFHFHVCTVMLPDEASLPVFGFWLLNVCPLSVGESADDRAWTILLLLNARDGRAAVVPGYAAERWLGDKEWTKALQAMASHWKAGGSARAVVRFFAAAAALLDASWKLRGLRRAQRSHP